MFYLACPECRKKVIDDGRGYFCESCNKCQEEARPTYNFTFRIQDCTDSLMVQCIGEAGDQILGMQASELYAIRDSYEEMKAMNLE